MMQCTVTQLETKGVYPGAFLPHFWRAQILVDGAARLQQDADTRNEALNLLSLRLFEASQTARVLGHADAAETIKTALLALEATVDAIATGAAP